ncbi:hypothetical protein [Micromonospora sp. I033]
MHPLQRRAALAATVSLAALAVGAWAGAAPALAQQAESGTFSVGGDPGDPVTLGGSHSYATTAGDVLDVNAYYDAEHSINVAVTGANGDWWQLKLAAPNGQDLAAGSYPDAGNYETDTRAGLSLLGNGRSCANGDNSFTIHELVFGPYGYVEKLDASFVQHCTGATGAAYGEVHLVTPPPAPALGLVLDVATSGTADGLNGKATVRGTVTCTEPVTVTITGEVGQQRNRLRAEGAFRAEAACTPGTAVAWSAVAAPAGEVAFGSGDAEVVAHATGYDATWNKWPTVDDAAVVRLKKV